MKPFLRVMECEVQRDEKEINNNDEWIGQQSPLVRRILQHDGKSVKDYRSRDPLAFILTEEPVQIMQEQERLPLIFFFF